MKMRDRFDRAVIIYSYHNDRYYIRFYNSNNAYSFSKSYKESFTLTQMHKMLYRMGFGNHFDGCSKQEYRRFLKTTKENK